MSEIEFGLLGDIAKGKRGVSYKPEDIVQGTDQKYCRLLTAGNIQDGITTTESYTKVPDKCVSQEQLISPDDILVCMSNGSKRLVGKSSRLRSADSKQYCVGAFCSTFTPTGNADPEFVFQVFQSEIFRRQVSDALEGSAINNLKNSTIENFQVPLPPLPEQKKIAEILSGIDQAIEKSIATLGKISTLSKAVLEVANHQYAKEDTEELRDVCELITKGATPTTYGHKLTTNRSFDSVSFLGGGNASPEGRFIYGPERFCSQEATKSLRRSDLKEGDSLVTIVGYVGNTCIIPKEILPANINQNVALVRADSSRLHHKYLHLFLRTRGGMQLAQIATTQAQPSVSLKQVGDLGIHLPSMEEQLRAIKQADSFFRKETQLEGKIESLRLLKTAVASDLLSGRKRVSI